MSKNVTKVLALSKTGKVEDAHCPLVLPKNRKSLELSFNYIVRNEQIIELEISNEFKCKSDTQNMCVMCPFRNR